jgi:RNA polymerase sigma-70 factor, ECF subfamily
MNGTQIVAAVSVVAAAPRETCADNDLSAFLQTRARLFGIAYRMLGDVAEAEDIVQEAWVRWQTTDRSRVRNPPAFLVTAATRLAINVLHSARARRETLISRSLADAIDTGANPAVEAERDEALKFAALLLMEKLSPTQRAAYVLREAFNYPYRKIADILRMKEANVRQLVTRARDQVSGRPRASASSTEQRRFHDVLSAACRTGDLTNLERLLVSDIVPNSERSGHSLGVGRRSFNRARSRRRAPARQCSAGSSWARPGKEKSL